ncbi:PAS domain S-box protein [Candidatus Bathyarchaeota archaeon]|nr:PAS domain S-box protein [Candidatus Bathyarchaeota archaeon]
MEKGNMEKTSDPIEYQKELTTDKIPEEMYKDLFELAPDPIVTINLKGIITSANSASFRDSGVQREDIIGKTIYELPFLRVEDIPKFLKVFNSVLRGEKTAPIEVTWQSKDGAYHINEVHVGLIKRNGKIVGVQAISRDITHRKEMAKMLSESEQKFKRLFCNIPEAAVYWDSDFRVIDINPQFTRLFGYTLEEVKGKNNVDIIIPPDRLEEAWTLGKMAKDGYVDYDTVRAKKDGSLVSVSLSAAPIIVKNQVVGFVGLYKDITERVKARQELQRQKEMAENYLNIIGNIIVALDTDGKITLLNRRGHEILGYEEGELIGENWFDKCLPKEVRKEVKRIFKQITLEKGEAYARYENLVCRKDGSTRLISWHNTVLKDADGRIIGTLSSGEDITELKKMQEKLEQYSEQLENLVHKKTEELLESERRYSILVEEASDGVVLLQDGKIVFANKKAKQIAGYTSETKTAVLLEKVIAEKDWRRAENVYQKVLQGKVFDGTMEIELKTFDNRSVPIELSGALILYQNRPAILVILRDVSERKRMEEQRTKLEKMAVIGELATMVAHDLRNPLASIRNASYYIKTSCPSTKRAECKTALEMINVIEQETITANNIINELLDFSFKKTLQKKTQMVERIVENALRATKIPKNISVKKKFQKSIMISGDEQLLERVFLNIIKNAVEAMPNGGTLTITTSETDNHAEISFIDTGVGISEENMSKLFTPLYTTKAKGIGMGLSICRKIIDQHGGTIEVRSKPNCGAAFMIRLPKS